MRYLKNWIGKLPKCTELITSFLIATTSVVFLIHKIDFFEHFRFLSSPKIIYVTLLIFTLFAALIVTKKLFLNEKLILFLTILLPSTIILFLGVNFFENHLHPIFSITVGFYFIALGTAFITQYHKKYENINSNSVNEHDAKLQNSKIIYLIIFTTVVIHLFFGIKDIGNAAYVDEKLWIYDRVEQYLDNIREQDWRNTRPSDKPGVSTAIIAGSGLLFFDPTDFDEGAKMKESLSAMFSTFRIPQLLTITALSLLTFLLIKKNLNTSIAYLGTIFILLSPILLGISRIINPDALLWITLFNTFLCFTLYLKNPSLKWIYLCGFFLGISLLTKYIANIFVVFFLVLIFIDFILQKKLSHDLSQKIKERIIHYGILIFVSLATFYTLYPGTWVKHDRMLLATIQSEAFSSTWVYFAIIVALIAIDTFVLKNIVLTKILQFLQKQKMWIVRVIIGIFIFSTLITLFNVYTKMSVFDFTSILESPKSSHRDVSPLAIYITSYFPLLFGITPFVLIFALYGTFKTFIWEKHRLKNCLTIYSVLFILLYYFASTINDVVPIVRYQIVLYPFIILIAAIGLHEFIGKFSKKTMSVIITGALIIVTGIAQLSVLNGFYFSHNSSFLPQSYIINPKDMGDGNYKIAQYLNALPNPENTLIWTDKRGICQFFVGKCNNMIQDPAIIDIAPKIDYYIISQNRESYIQRLTEQKLNKNNDYKIRLDRLYDPLVPAIHTLHPSNRTPSYIKIINAKNINIISN